MEKVYENKEEGIKVYQGKDNKFYPKAKKGYTGFLKIFDTYHTVFAGASYKDTEKNANSTNPFYLSQPVAENSLEVAVSLAKLLRADEDGHTQQLGMGLKPTILDTIVKMRSQQSLEKTPGNKLK